MINNDPWKAYNDAYDTASQGGYVPPYHELHAAGGPAYANAATGGYNDAQRDRNGTAAGNSSSNK